MKRRTETEVEADQMDLELSRLESRAERMRSKPGATQMWGTLAANIRQARGTVRRAMHPDDVKGAPG